MGRQLPLVSKNLQTVIIPQLPYRASIWYTPKGEKRNQQTLVTQLVQAPATWLHLIIEAFKAISTQVLKIEAYLISINLEQDKKTIQIAARLFSGSLYHTLTQGWSKHVMWTLTSWGTLEKYYIKFVDGNIDELERRSGYIVPPWCCSPSINIPSSKERAT